MSLPCSSSPLASFVFSGTCRYFPNSFSQWKGDCFYVKQVMAKAALEPVGNKAIACTAVWEAHLEGKELGVF